MGRRPMTVGLRSSHRPEDRRSHRLGDHRLAPLPRPSGRPARHPGGRRPSGQQAASKPPRAKPDKKTGRAGLLEEGGDVEIVVVPKVETGAGQLHLCVNQAQGPARERSGTVVIRLGR